MWQAYYRRQPVRLFGLLVRANREQAGVGWPRAVLAAYYLARAAVQFGRAQGDYDRFEPDIASGYRALRLPPHIDVATRRAARAALVGRAAGDRSDGRLSGGRRDHRAVRRHLRLPEADVVEAGRLRGEAAEVRDRGATDDPAGRAAPAMRTGPRSSGCCTPRIAACMRPSDRGAPPRARRRTFPHSTTGPAAPPRPTTTTS